MDPVLIDIDGAAAALRIGRTTTYKLISEGKLQTVMIGRRRLVRIESVRALADKAA